MDTLTGDKPMKPQLSLRSLLEIIAIIAVILAFYFSRSHSVGRYSLYQQAQGSSLLLDTQTGQTWYMDKSKSTNSWYPDMPAVNK
ncbi:hypothetical protein [Anatilimnocola floriformis]|uniref:hypothetical protein n=1 Tax=Anatilimnocola floriformis TaxID=2948575 RepID=UPI0020C4AE55|nr:hypothetical protein [Anatilimnocola floriformis]